VVPQVVVIPSAGVGILLVGEDILRVEADILVGDGAAEGTKVAAVEDIDEVHA
jgi:hypothetical protein